METFRIQKEKTLYEKLSILSDAAKYDVACTSSGIKRSGDGTGIGNCEQAGICHSFTPDGRCVSLLKILFTNECIFDCKYCINRASNDVERTSFTPDEICRLVIEFYRRNYIEGLFLSSGVWKSPDYTMRLIYETLLRLRREISVSGIYSCEGDSRSLSGSDPNDWISGRQDECQCGTSYSRESSSAGTAQEPKEYSGSHALCPEEERREQPGARALSPCSKICPGGAEHPDDYWGDAGK